MNTAQKKSRSAGAKELPRLTNREKKTATSAGSIAAIKLLRERTGLPLHEASEVVRSFLSQVPSKKPDPEVSEAALIDQIVASAADRHYKYHRDFRRSVAAATRLVMNHLRDCRDLYPEHWIDEITAEGLEEHDRHFIERIACVIHSARIETGY